MANLKSPQFAVVNNTSLNELFFQFYLHHQHSGPNKSQKTVVDSKMDNWFGKMVVNDWPIYDGVGHDAKVVARAQGFRVQAGLEGSGWHNCFTIVFEDARFKGSTLQVMGTLVEDVEWAIVGGTGEFAMANGVIYKKLHTKKSEEKIVELHLHAFYFPLRTGVSCWTLGV